MTCLLCRCNNCRKARRAVLDDMLQTAIVKRQIATMAEIEAWRDVDQEADQLAADVVAEMAET